VYCFMRVTKSSTRFIDVLPETGTLENQLLGRLVQVLPPDTQVAAGFGMCNGAKQPLQLRGKQYGLTEEPLINLIRRGKTPVGLWAPNHLLRVKNRNLGATILVMAPRAAGILEVQLPPCSTYRLLDLQMFTPEEASGGLPLIVATSSGSSKPLHTVGALYLPAPCPPVDQWDMKPTEKNEGKKCGKFENNDHLVKVVIDEMWIPYVEIKLGHFYILIRFENSAYHQIHGHT
ncbi:hypothetical protein MJT46_015661, partial [Ovis ammon polii x Ovis aries]